MFRFLLRIAMSCLVWYGLHNLTLAAEISQVNVEIKGAVDVITGEISPKLNLTGKVKGNKTLIIKQQGFVFFMQSLKDEDFQFDGITPFFADRKITVLMRNQIGESQSLVLYPIPFQKKTLMFEDAGNHSIDTVVALNQQETDPLVREVKTVNIEAEDSPVAVNTHKNSETNAEAKEVDAVAAASATTEEPEFDLSFINRGRDKNINQNIIKNLNQIIPGRYSVDLVLNDEFIAKTDVNFTRRGPDSDSKACLTAQHIYQLGIKTEKLKPKAADIFANAKLNSKNSDGQEPCLYIDEWVEKSTEKYDKGDLVLAISVPQAFIKKSRQQSLPPSMLSFGETAGFTNYNFNSFQSSYQGIKNSGQFLNLDSGVNMLGWQFRQSGFISANTNAPTEFRTGDLSANRTLIDWKSRLSLGAISSQSPVIGSVPVKGIRVSSEEALYPDDEKSFKPAVRGFARTNARVKIKQNGVIFFEQNVPPGPFEFTELNPVSNIGDLLVTVSESDGTEQNFIVPYSNTYGKLNKGSIRYNITAGTYRNNYQTNASDNKALLQSYVRYGLNDFITPAIDSLMSANYQTIGTQFNFGNTLGNQSFNMKVSRLSDSLNAQGQQYSANISGEPIGFLRLGSNLSYQSRYFLDANSGLSHNSSDSTFNLKNSLKMTRSLFGNVNLNKWGNFNLNFTQQDSWSENRINQNISFNYNIRVMKVNLSAGLTRSKNNFGDNANQTINSVTLNASIPLSLLNNHGNLSAYVSQTGAAQASQNVYYTGNYSEDINYSLSQSKQAAYISESASLNISHAMGNSSLGISSAHSGNTSTSFGTSGSLVFHQGGLIAAQPLGETFGILEVPGGSGVRVSGSKSTVNRSGYGVVPNLSPYAMNIVDLDLSNAPLDVELESTSQRAAPVSGAIVRLTYASITGRPLLVHFSGEKIPFGAAVLSEKGEELGTLGPGNRGLIRVKSDKGKLKVTWGDEPEESCASTYEIKASEKALNSGYTLMELSCAR